MPKRFDTNAELYANYKAAKKYLQRISAEQRAADKREKELLKELIKRMGNSKEASINGKPAFKIGEAGRDSTTVPLVRQYVPEYLWPVVIKHITWPVVEFLDEEEDSGKS